MYIRVYTYVTARTTQPLECLFSALAHLLYISILHVVINMMVEYFIPLPYSYIHEDGVQELGTVIQPNKRCFTHCLYCLKPGVLQQLKLL